MSIKRTTKPDLLTVLIACTLLACNLSTGTETQLTETALPNQVPQADQVTTEDAANAQNETEDDAAPPQAQPVQASAPVEVIQTHSVPDEGGGLQVFGLIQNNADRAVDEIEIEVQVYDAGNNFLRAQVTGPMLHVLAPGQISPFALWVTEDLASPTRATAQIVGHSLSGTEIATVEIRGELLTIDDDGDAHISGEIYNGNRDPVSINSLAGAVFDSAGSLISADTFAALSQYLDPGEVSPFRVTLTGPTERSVDIAGQEIYVDANITEPAEYFDLAFTDDPSYYFDANGVFHLVGKITNNSDQFLSLELVAGIYDGVDFTLDAASTGLALASIAPGETQAYDFDLWGPTNDKADFRQLASQYSVQWDPYHTWVNETRYVNISTQNETVVFDDYKGTFTGEIVNDSGQALRDAVVIVHLLDGEGSKIVAINYGSMYEEIPVDGMMEYQIPVDIAPAWNTDNLDLVVIAKGELP